MSEYLTVSVIYGSEEYEGFKPIYQFIKTFIFTKLPCIPAYIKLPSEVYSSIYFKDPAYDPEKDEYIISAQSCFMLQRYYHCDRLETAKEYASKFEKEGWTIITL